MALDVINLFVKYLFATQILHSLSRFPASTDYIFTRQNRGIPLPPSIAYGVLPSGIVVEPSPVRGLAADCPLLRCLGFNLAPSSNFFLLSLPSRLGVSHPHVVVLLALGVPSISKGCFSNTLPCRRTEWLQC